MNALSAAAAVGDLPSGNKSSAQHSAKTVLVVEDNLLNMKLFHVLLEAHGYNVLQTRDGMEALRLTREHRPDMILMDTSCRTSPALR